MKFYYWDDDKDGKGDASSPPVPLPAETPPEGYSNNNLDRCDKNPFREEPGKCGCEYQRKSEDCEDDEDGDGVTNAIDDVDDRIVRRDEAIRCFKKAKDAALTAERLLGRLEEDFRRESSHQQKLQAVDGIIDVIRAEIESALLHLYDARFLADFGKSLDIAESVAGPAKARRITAVTDIGSFGDFFEAVKLIDDLAAETISYWNKVGGQRASLHGKSWRDQLTKDWREKWKAGEAGERTFIKNIADNIVGYLDFPKKDQEELEAIIKRQIEDESSAASVGSVP